MFTKLNHRLAHGTLPYGARLAFIAIAAINLPGAIIAGIFFWTVLPLPALVLYIIVLILSFGKGSIKLAKDSSFIGLFYHLILLGLLLAQFIETGGLGTGDKLWARLAMITYVAGPMGLYALASKMLHETPDTQAHA